MAVYDVIVAGAGPSGSTTALRLARLGARVLLLDRAEFPREKPCGGGVTARAFEQSPVDLSPVVEQRVHRVRFSFRLGRSFDYEYASTLVYMTQRRRLDAYLVEQAAAAGADFRDGLPLRGLELLPEGVEVRANGDVFRARALVGADGANGIVARTLGLSPVQDPPVALEANFPYASGSPPGEWQEMLALELGSVAGGYGWSFPKADHFNVGCGGWRSEGGRLRDHLAALKSHYGLAEAPTLNLRGHHLPTRRHGAAIVRGPVLLVGDAAGLVDPMSGEGIHSAFVSARLAAGAIAALLEGEQPDLWPFEVAVEQQLMPEIRAASILRDAYHFSPLPCFAVLRRSELFRRSLCQLMTGEKTYSGFLESLGPLQAVLRLWASLGRAARLRAGIRG